MAVESTTRRQLLENMQDLLGNESAKPWHLWWQEHREAAEALLERPSFLYLKYKKYGGAAQILDNEGVPVQWSEEARERAKFCHFSPRCLDDKGRPRRDRVGLAATYLPEWNRGDDLDDTVDELVERLRSLDANERMLSVHLSDMTVHADKLLEAGFTEDARPIVLAVLQFCRHVDPPDLYYTARDQALELLTRLD